jgi:hypothetical protein
LTPTTKIEENFRKGECAHHQNKFIVNAASIMTQLLIYRRAIRPTIPARRPAAGLTLEAAPVKTPVELASGWAAEGWAGVASAGVLAAWDSAG